MKNNRFKRLLMAALFLFTGFVIAEAQNVVKENASKNMEMQVFASNASAPVMLQKFCPEPAQTDYCNVKITCGKTAEAYSVNCSNSEECDISCCYENCCNEDCCDIYCDDVCCEEGECIERCIAAGCID